MPSNKLTRLTRKTIQKATEPCCILVYADWCPHSRSLHETLSKYSGKRNILVVFDTDEALLQPDLKLPIGGGGYPRLYKRNSVGGKFTMYPSNGSRTISALTTWMK